MAWAAGFFDGEGNTGFYGRQLRVQVAQKHREPLDRFTDAVGGGKVYGPYTNNQGNVHFEYRATGRNGRTIIDRLLPLLTNIKRTQAESAFAKRRAFEEERGL